jgi:mannose-6-phosphate isomerase-like protein (cupin superfamily)/alkylhydroperoxidase/carboxymuconolactone decarboxylase family protein YurZ
MPPWTTRQLSPLRDHVGPDGSEIHLLARVDRGSTSLCQLPEGAVSLGMRHRTVEEIWYVVGGVGELWRKRDDEEETVALVPGTSVSIPRGTSFQFRNTGSARLHILITTMPPWPGAEEAEPVGGRWVSPSERAPVASSYDTVGALRRLNLDIGDAERVGDAKRLAEILADTLDFRRADGTVVDKQTFLADLARRKYTELSTSDVRIAVFEDVAVATLVVTVAGTADGTSFGGRFRNLRIFERMGDEWSLVRWYNRPIPAGAPPSPEATYERVLGEPFDGPVDGLRWNTLQHLYGQIWNRGILTDRDRRLITLSLLASQGHRKQLGKHIHGARASGMSIDELQEIMVQVAHYAGWAAGTGGQELVAEQYAVETCPVSCHL